MGGFVLKIDGVSAEARRGATILEAADSAGIYVPRLCAHPALRTSGHCGLCAVEVERDRVVRACETPAAEGMAVLTASAAAQAAREGALRALLAIHPHVCLTCDLRDGCSRTECSYAVAVEERCCGKFGACEFQRVSAFVGIPADAPQYIPSRLPIAAERLYTRDPNLCIGCLRCEDACRDLAGAGAVGRLVRGGRVVAGPAAGTTLEEAGCVFCGACLQVCPTGALLAGKDAKARRWLEKTRSALHLEAPPEPPGALFALEEAAVRGVPEVGGVYHLYDDSGAVVKIKGVADLRRALREEAAAGSASWFTWEESPLYTSRESQLIQRHLARHGSIPGGDELDDLF